MRQLIFTSALSGVAPGRSGFCTVARHASLRERTVAELEKMSVYEPPEGTRPTVFLFRVYSGGNEPLYILTRAGDAGLDDFGRPNYVVHHLIFHKAETARLLPPAEVALRFRGWCEKFTGTPTLFEAEDELPEEILRGENETLLPAKRWEALTGNAGNAALLCPHGEARGTIFVGADDRAGEVLGLFAESAEVAGAASAWEIAFATGICTRGNPGRFLWRLVDEAEIKTRRPGDFVLDFLAPLEFLHPPKTIFAEYARTGILPAKKASAVPAPKTAEATPAEPLRERENLPAESVAEKLDGGEGSTEKPRAEEHRMRFSDIAGTAKFLGISVGMLVAILLVIFFLKPDARPLKLRRADVPVATVDGTPKPETLPESYQKLLDAKIKAGDFCAAAEVWLSFVEACPQDAEKVKEKFLPRFRMKVPGAFADRFAARMRPLDFGGKLTAEDKQILVAELAMFRKVWDVLDLSLRQIQKKNLSVITRAETVAAE